MEKKKGARLSLDPIGSLFGDTWKLYKERWSVLVEIVLLPMLVVLLGEVIIGLGLGFPFDALGGLVIFAGYIVLMYSVLPVIFSIHHGAGVDDSYKATIGWFWPFVWVAIVEVLAFAGSFMMLIVPGIWLGIAMSFVAYVFVMEHRRGVDALRQSKDYIKGYWWAVLGRSLLLALIMVVVMFVAEVPIAVLGGRAAGSIVSLAITLFFVPFSAIYHYRIFGNLRELKPELAHEHTTKGTGFIKTSAIVGIAAPIVIALLLVGLAGAGIMYMIGHADRYPAPSPGNYSQYPPIP